MQKRNCKSSSSIVNDVEITVLRLYQKMVARTVHRWMSDNEKNSDNYKKLTLSLGGLE